MRTLLNLERPTSVAELLAGDSSPQGVEKPSQPAKIDCSYKKYIENEFLKYFTDRKKFKPKNNGEKI